jgi:hypothetical protein
MVLVGKVLPLQILRQTLVAVVVLEAIPIFEMALTALMAW